jgi:arylsulfatase A-like enzyme
LASILTSQYPVTHGIRKNGAAFKGSEPCLAEVLREQGYACAAFFANPWMANLRWPGFDPLLLGTEVGATEQAVAWLRENYDRPFFLWLHLYAPHSPFEPQPEWGRVFVDSNYDGDLDGSDYVLYGVTLDRRPLSQADLNHVLNLYDAEVRYNDDLAGRLLATLDKVGQTENTLTVFTADHGEELYDRHCYFYHLASVYDSVLRIPLVIRWPGRIPEGHRINAVVESIDIAPTLLEFLEIPEPAAFQGTSLSPMLNGEEMDLGPAFSEWEDKVVTMRTARHRYVFNPTGYHPRWANKRKMAGRKGDPLYPIGDRELYDLTAEPLERTNLVDKKKDVAAELHKKTLSWMEEYNWLLDGGSIHQKIDKELKDQLEAAGYVL